MQSRVTIEGVAKAAGVSRQTVSRVINRSPNVKASVRQRIEALVALLDQRQIPCARIGHRGDGAHIEVFMDERRAAREVTETLLAMGHRRLGFVAGAPSYVTSLARVEGFLGAIASAGLPDEAALVRNGDFKFDTAAHAIGAMLTGAHPPTAVMIAKACERLIAAAAGEGAAGYFELPFHLVERASSGACKP